LTTFLECTINFPGAKTTHMDDLEILRVREAAKMSFLYEKLRKIRWFVSHYFLLVQFCSEEGREEDEGMEDSVGMVAPPLPCRTLGSESHTWYLENSAWSAMALSSWKFQQQSISRTHLGCDTLSNVSKSYQHKEYVV